MGIQIKVQQICSDGSYLSLVNRIFHQDKVTIGRAFSNDIVLAEPEISSEHAQVELRNQSGVLQLFILDLYSSNGTYVSGKQIPSQTEYALVGNERVEIGKFVLSLAISAAREYETVVHEEHKPETATSSKKTLVAGPEELQNMVSKLPLASSPKTRELKTFQEREPAPIVESGYNAPLMSQEPSNYEAPEMRMVPEHYEAPIESAYDSPNSLYASDSVYSDAPIYVSNEEQSYVPDVPAAPLVDEQPVIETLPTEPEQVVSPMNGQAPVVEVEIVESAREVVGSGSADFIKVEAQRTEAPAPIVNDVLSGVDVATIAVEEIADQRDSFIDKPIMTPPPVEAVTVRTASEVAPPPPVRNVVEELPQPQYEEIVDVVVDEAEHLLANITPVIQGPSQEDKGGTHVMFAEVSYSDSKPVVDGPLHYSSTTKELREHLCSLLSSKLEYLNRVFSWSSEGRVKPRAMRVLDELVKVGGIITGPENEKEALFAEVVEEVIGLGPISGLLDDDTVSEVSVSAAGAISIVRAGKREWIDSCVASERSIPGLVTRLRGTAVSVDTGEPAIEMWNVDNRYQLQVMSEPWAAQGLCFCLKKFRKADATMDSLVEQKMLSPEMRDFIMMAVKNSCNIVVSGPRGAGKTTLLNALVDTIPLHEGVLVVEEIAELASVERRHNAFSFQTNPWRSKAASPTSLVTYGTALGVSRIVLGECKGAEAEALISSMLQGYRGSIASVAAVSSLTAVNRLERFISEAHPQIPEAVVRKEVTSAVDIVIHVEELSDGSRKVTAISELLSSGEALGDYLIEDVFVYSPELQNGQGEHAAFRPQGYMPTFCRELMSAGAAVDEQLFGIAAG